MLDLTQPKQAHMDERLRKDIIIWLNSVRPNGKPHSVPVWFLWDGNTVLIFSQPNNQKIRNLRQNSAVVLALDNTNGGSDVVTLEGTAELLSEPSAKVLPPAYIEKYGARIQGIGWTPESMTSSYSQAIRVTPTKFL